jgi:hypothetical protein
VKHMKTTWKCVSAAGIAVVLCAGVWLAHRQIRSSSPRTEPLTRRDLPTEPLAVNGVMGTNELHSKQTLATITTGNEKLARPARSERIRLVVDDPSHAGFAKRVKALLAIKTKLTEAEILALYHYLQVPGRNPTDRDRENWLRNDMMDKLIEQESVPHGLVDLLVGIYQDRNQDVVMRDYAVQHMTPLYGKMSAEDQAAVRQSLWQATQETDSTIAGTALLALLRLAQPGPAVSPDLSNGIDVGQIAAAAYKLAADDRCGKLSRTTAVQVCGQLHVAEALPVIEQLSKNAPDLVLRVAATAALGDIGGAEAIQTLTSLTSSPDQLQVVASKAALNRLVKRTGILTAMGDTVQPKEAP